MPVRLAWDDDKAKTVIRYIAEGVWTWSDLHKNARLAAYAVEGAGHSVETLIDLSHSARLPGGAIAHLRSLGRRDTPNRQPRVIIIGVDPAVQQQLGAVDGVYRTAESVVYFVPDEAAAQALLASWRGA